MPEYTEQKTKKKVSMLRVYFVEAVKRMTYLAKKTLWSEVETHRLPKSTSSSFVF